MCDILQTNDDDKQSQITSNKCLILAMQSSGVEHILACHFETRLQAHIKCDKWDLMVKYWYGLIKIRQDKKNCHSSH